jgi:nucleoside-diphosphate-sugar epimerase
MKKAIISGGAGFVGSALVNELLAHGVEVTCIVRPGFSGKKAESRIADSDVRLIECDLKEIQRLPELTRERGFDTYYQLIWDGLHGEPLRDYTTQIMNIKWVMDSIMVAAELECDKFVGSGSVSQYELDTIEGRVSEGDKHKVYKTAKLCCEYMGRSVASDHGVEFIWPIITNIFGIGETSPRLVNTMIRNLLAGKHQALSEGDQLYDFIYISDAAKAFRLIGECGRQDRKYILAGGNVQPLKNFLSVIGNIVAPEMELGFGEMAFNGIYLPEECYDISELVADTGFQPDISFEEGIRRTVEWVNASTMY